MVSEYGYIGKDDLLNVVAFVARKFKGLSRVATSGKYSDLSGVPDIPSKTSQLTNDSDFTALSESEYQQLDTMLK